MIAPAVLVGLVGVWLFFQGTAGRLPARLLSGRQLRPGEVPPPAAAAPAGPGGSLSIPAGPGGFASPLADWHVNDTFHSPTRPNHQGIDLAAQTGTPVAASKAGRVTQAGPNGGYGNSVIIDHGDGWTTLYGHLSSISVTVGDQVTQGQIIAASGATGNVTGPHLHFETRQGGTPVDPATVVGR